MSAPTATARDLGERYHMRPRRVSPTYPLLAILTPIRYAHYVTSPARHLTSPSHKCAYGPSSLCAIDTNRPFRASFTFTPSGTPFSFEVELHQEGRTATVGPVQYGAYTSDGIAPPPPFYLPPTSLFTSSSPSLNLLFTLPPTRR